MKRTIGFAASVAASLLLCTPAFAGETNGKGGDIRGGDNARSACHFSGKDVLDADEDNPPGFDDDAVTGGHVQSYGQYVRAGLKGAVPAPGDACRGNVEFGG